MIEGEVCDEQLIEKKKPGWNDELVRIRQALLQAGALMVPDHTPALSKRALQENNPNCPLVIFWHLYSKDANVSDSDSINDPIILNLEKRTQNDIRLIDEAKEEQWKTKRKKRQKKLRLHLHTSEK